MGRSRDLGRKFESGAAKTRKKKKQLDFLKKQKGSLDRYIFANSEANTVSPKEPTSYCENRTQNECILPAEEAECINALMRIDIREINWDDPAEWPETFKTTELENILKNGPVRNCKMKYPSNSENRHFSNRFFTRVLSNGDHVDRAWLVYSNSKDCLFCFCCKIFEIGPKSNTALISPGFRDWKHISPALRKHENSQAHLHNLQRWIESKQSNKNDPISTALKDQIKNEERHWREVLKRLLRIVLYFSEHNLAFRGQNDRLFATNNGNFLGLVEMMSEFDDVLKEHLRRIKNEEIHTHYLGKRIQNEFLDLLSNTVKAKIVLKIKSAKYYSILLDCTPDVSHQEQMSLVVRIVNIDEETVKIEEHFLEFIPVKSSTGQYLKDSAISALKKNGLNIMHCRGQGYDNGANMKGKHAGVQARILQLNPRAFYTPCACHSLNLVLCDTASCNVKASHFFGVLIALYNLFSASTGKWDILKKHADVSVKKWSETRWESRINSVKAVRFQFKEVVKAIEDCADKETDALKRQSALSLVNKMTTLDFTTCLVVWYEILLPINCLSKILQKDDIDLGEALTNLDNVLNFFKEYRKTGFEKAVEEAEKLLKDVNVEPAFECSRIRRKVKLNSHEKDDDPLASSRPPKKVFEIEFFNFVVDAANIAFEERFHQLKLHEENFGFLYYPLRLKDIDDQILFEKCTNLEKTLEVDGNKDLDGRELFTELKIFRHVINESMKTPLEVLKSLVKIFTGFPNLTIAYRILLTMAVTVATAERSFSKMKLIKNYLRSEMSQERLNSLALLSIERDLCKIIDFDEIIDSFAESKARKYAFN